MRQEWRNRVEWKWDKKNSHTLIRVRINPKYIFLYAYILTWLHNFHLTVFLRLDILLLLVFLPNTVSIYHYYYCRSKWWLDPAFTHLRLNWHANIGRLLCSYRPQFQINSLFSNSVVYSPVVWHYRQSLDPIQPVAVYLFISLILFEIYRPVNSEILAPSN